MTWQGIENVNRWANICREESPDALFNPMEHLKGLALADNPSEIVEKPFIHNAAKLKKLKEFPLGPTGRGIDTF